MDKLKIDTEALQVFSPDEARYYELLPYGFDAGGRLLCLGREGKDYASALEEIRLLFGREVAVRPTDEGELSKLLLTGYRSTSSSLQGEFPKEPSEMVAFLIRDAYGMRASDIHMEPSERRCRIRYRVDGRLVERHVIPVREYAAASSTSRRGCASTSARPSYRPYTGRR